MVDAKAKLTEQRTEISIDYKEAFEGGWLRNNLVSLVRRGFPTGDLRMSIRSKADRQHRSKIDLHDQSQLRCWTKQLGVNQAELEKAIETVGNGAAAVRKELLNVRRPD